MPTLIEVEVSVPCEPLNESDSSETILYDESVTLLDEESCVDDQQQHHNVRKEGGRWSLFGQPSSNSPAKPTTRDDDTIHDAMLDESNMILSRSIPGEETIDERDDVAWRGEYRSSPQAPQTKAMASEAVPETRYQNVRNNTIGPNQMVYCSKHETLVKITIRDFDRRHPGKLRDYRSLSSNEQAKEQQRVRALLSRVGISNSYQHHLQEKDHNDHIQPLSSPFIDRERLLNDTLSPFLSPDCHGPPQMEVQNPTRVRGNVSVMTNSLQRNQSCILPSSFDYQGPSMSFRSNHVGEKLLRTSSESVELARGAMDASVCSGSNPIYDSPESLKPNPYKRQASSSAKRGSDLSRTKYNEDVLPSPLDDDSVSSHLMDAALSTRMERLSISPTASTLKDVFPASQSPISPKLTYDSSSDSDDHSEDARKWNRSARHELDLQRNQASDDTIETSTTYCNLDPRTMRDITASVGMKEGSTFHIEKLDVRRCEMTRLTSGTGGTRRRLIHFPDPLSKYNSKQQIVLNDVFESLIRSECDSKNHTSLDTSSANVLFSLSFEQIMDLCVKVLLDDERNAACERRPSQNLIPLQAQTLIVIRDKDQAETWGRVLREGTGCSVYNHSAAPLSERVRHSTAEKATKFDVVLTTYDALKAADVTIPVDALGHAILSSSTEESGWLNSRTVSSQCTRPQLCKALSVLHKLNFHRAIFVDLLGRKSFLAKKGTSRAAAAVALRAKSR